MSTLQFYAGYVDTQEAIFTGDWQSFAIPTDRQELAELFKRFISYKIVFAATEQGANDAGHYLNMLHCNKTFVKLAQATLPNSDKIAKAKDAIKALCNLWEPSRDATEDVYARNFEIIDVNLASWPSMSSGVLTTEPETDSVVALGNYEMIMLVAKMESVLTSVGFS